MIFGHHRELVNGGRCENMVCHCPGEIGNQAGHLYQTAKPRDYARPAIKLTASGGRDFSLRFVPCHA
jgi:hypothetical protein